MLDMLANGGAHVIVAVGAGVISFFKSFKFIQEGEEGMKLRFGKVIRNRDGSPRVIKPGFAFLIPWVDTLQRRHDASKKLRSKLKR